MTLLWLFGVLAVACGRAAARTEAPIATTVVALISGEPVVAEELRAHLVLERAGVAQYFQDRYHAQDSPAFWTSPFGGETPIEVLRKRALDGLVRSKVQMVLMKDHGIITDASYRAFLRTWEEENRRRRDVLARGGRVYGPQQFSEEAFYTYVLSNGARELRKRLANTALSHEEGDLRALYEATKSNYAKGYSATVQVISLSIAALDQTQRIQARRRLEVARGRLAAGAQIADVMAALPEGQMREQELEALSAQRRRLGVPDRITREGLSLSPKEVSGVIDLGAAIAIVLCVDRRESGYIPFGDVRGSLEQRYLSQAYERYIDQRVREARIEIRQPAFDAVRW